MQKLKGPFKEIIPMFQKYKKSIGYKYNNISNFIYLDNKLYKEKILDLSDSKKIYEILISNELNINKKERNYKSLSQLYEFMKILGYKNLYLEPLFFKSKKHKITVLTKKDIENLFHKIDDYSQKNNEKMYPVIFRLIYSCGLRISELQNLKISDFSLENQAITIVKSKYNITRIIPLSTSMFEILKIYLDTIKDTNDKYLFEKNGKKISIKSLENFIKYIYQKDTIRVHDLRHTFAIHTLNNAFKDNINASEVLYPLSIYMGHSSIKSTEYYLQFTNEIYKETVKDISKLYPNLFPKVGDIDE